jgi:hypothetical protein
MTVEKFLKTIGRGCDEYIDKLTWEKLMTSGSRQLKQLGIPCRQRKWILLWVEKYRQVPVHFNFKEKLHSNFIH